MVRRQRRDAAWVNNDYFGGVCIFESDRIFLRGRPDLDAYQKPAAGFTLRVVSPGQPVGLYHYETNQFVGAGDGPCVILGAGNRSEDLTIVRPPSELALRYGAGVEEETTRFPHERYGEWRLERPETWRELPWAE